MPPADYGSSSSGEAIDFQSAIPAYTPRFTRDSLDATGKKIYDQLQAQRSQLQKALGEEQAAGFYTNFMGLQPDESVALMAQQLQSTGITDINKVKRQNVVTPITVIPGDEYGGDTYVDPYGNSVDPSTLKRDERGNLITEGEKFFNTETGQPLTRSVGQAALASNPNMLSDYRLQSRRFVGTGIDFAPNGQPIYYSTGYKRPTEFQESGLAPVLGLALTAALGPAGYGLSLPASGAIAGGLTGLAQSGGKIDEALKSALLGGATAYGLEQLFPVASGLDAGMGTYDVSGFSPPTGLDAGIGTYDVSGFAPPSGLDAGLGTYDVSSFTPYAPGEAGIQQILQGSQGIASLPSDLTVDEILASSLTTPEANLADLSTADLITPTAGEVVEPFDITDVVPATQELPQFSYEDMVPPSALPGYQPPASLGPSALDAGMGVYPTVPPQLEGLNALNAGMDVYPTVPPQLGGTDLSWMDKVSPSQMAAIGTGSLPGTTLGDKLAAGLGALGAKLATPQGVATAAMLAATAGDGGGGGAGGAGGGGGYGGAMPQYTLQRSIRPGVFDRTPYSTEPIMGRSFFTEPKYVPRETEMKAQGGILALNSGRYLRGKTDGMADKIPSNIDGVQPAALSHGEFVVPADVVSHLGNGNSDAGADVLYKMMDRVRKARTGTTKQGKQIDAAKYVPGGIVGFADGGVASSGVTATGGGVTGPFATSSSSTLSPWVAPSVTEALGRAEAFAFEPYKPYEGQLTATASPTQKEAFTAAKGLTAPSRDWSATMAQTYMNPYLEQVQKPLMSELDRQADIRQQAIQSEFTKAGAFGGARDVIARMENERNLQAAKAKLMGETQSAAFDQAMKMYGLERSRDIEDINAMLRAGEMERGVEGEGIKALQAQYEKEQAAPMERLTAYLNSLKGLPISTTATTPNLTDLQKFGLTASEAAKFYNVMETFFGPPKG